MRYLVLGGTRYFGKRLVTNLLAQGADITIASRGQAADPFGSAVRRIVVDRDDDAALAQALKEHSWDVVYDQICYSPDNARALLRALDGRVQRLIATSSQSVYGHGSDIREEVFDPTREPIRFGGREDYNYQEAKQLAEAVYAQTSGVSTTLVRFPIVLGPDDYTRRLHFHIERMAAGQPIYFPNLDYRISLASSHDAAALLTWLGSHQVEGPLNACSTESISLRELIAAVEKRLGKGMELAPRADKPNASPLGVGGHWFMDTAKMQKAGFRFSSIAEWLPPLVDTLVQETTGAG